MSASRSGRSRCQRRGAGCGMTFGLDQVHHGVDQRKVGECLREVAEMATAPGIDLLTEQIERAGVREELLAQLTRSLDLADLDQCRDQPERADRERALLA